MAEPTLRELHTLLLRLNQNVAESRRETGRLGARIEQIAAEVSAVALLDSKLDLLIDKVDHLDAKFTAANQILSGVRSLGESTFEIATGVSRRLRTLVQALIEAGGISFESMQDALLASDPRRSDVDEQPAAAENEQPR